MAQVRGEWSAAERGPQALNGRDASSNVIANERVPKLIFELLNDILITLPARECLPVERGSALGGVAGEGQLCFVNWNEARMISDSRGELSNFVAASNSRLSAEQLEEANLYLDESSFAYHSQLAAGGQQQMGQKHHQMIEQPGGSQALVSDLLQRLAGGAVGHGDHATFHDHTSSPLSPALDATNQHLSRMTYLSLGSLLALIGIITNLLILLIIFINTKQKCHNILGRGQTSHTNYHHLLLFQLTLTGLLLGGYILIDNINLYNGVVTQDIARRPREAGGRPFSPLSIYLPPSQFEAATDGAVVELESSLPVKPQENDDKKGLLKEKQPQQHTDDNETLSAFVIYLDAKKRHQDERPRKRLHHVSAASLVLVSCRPANLRHHSKAPPRKRELLAPRESSGRRDTASEPLDSSAMFFHLLATIHLWTVVALAYDRYCAIAHPLEYLRAINETKARTFLVILWTGSLLMNVILPLALGGALVPDLPEPAGRSTNQTVGRFTMSGDQLARSGLQQSGRPASEQQHFCSAQTVEPEMDIKRERVDVLQFVHFLIGLSAAHAPGSAIDSSRQQPAYLAIGLSLATFVLVILTPLVIITICNVSIYGIVKVHERRMSVSSGSQGGSYLGIGAFGSSVSSTLSHGHFMKRDSLMTNNTYLAANERGDTCSIGSSILGKLIRASAQVGAMGGVLINAASKEDTSSQCSSTNEHEICQLLADGNETRTNESNANNLDAQPVEDGCPAKAAVSAHYLSKSNCFKTRLAASESASFTPYFVSRLTRRRRRLVPSRQQQQQQQQQQKPATSPLNGPVGPANNRPAATQRETLLKKKLKRKLSDKEQGGGGGVASNWRACSRKSSFAPSEQTLILQELICPLAGDNCSCHSNQSASAAAARHSRQLLQHQQQLQADSDGIMRQLKMAGLSFAGIAISELMASPADRSRTLHRSSSWSLGNMHSLAHSNKQAATGSSSTANSSQTPATFQFCQPTSRCLGLNKQPALVEQQAPLPAREKRHSYVSLVLNPQQRDIWQEKFCTKLLFDSDSESHGGHLNQASCPRNSQQQQQQQQQYFNLGGTKSVAFNVVVWLILLMLTFTLPHFSLITIDQLLQVSRRASDALGDRLRANLTLLNELIEGGSEFSLEASRSDKTADELVAWLRGASIWFECICRLLFLLMLPLNGWLYGIRSRSLRTTLKMVLKRYISKKQASIEINQRRKSVVSTRSRESSVCCNSSSAVVHQASFCSPSKAQNCTPQTATQTIAQKQQKQQNEFPNGRVFRRCSSFNLPPQTRQDYYNSINEANEREAGCDQEQQARRSHNSSIRFVLNDNDHNQHQQEQAAAKDKARAHYGPDTAQASASNGAPSCLLPKPAPMSARYSTSQTLSLDSSSLASSHRSLLSASIQSSQSAALLLLDQRNLPAEGQPAPARHLPPAASRPTKLTGVLKKGGAAHMRRQESYDSATSAASRPSPSASLSGVLKKTSTSTKSILHQHAHHPTSGLAVSFGRTQSLDREDSFDSALSQARRAPANAGEQSISAAGSVAPRHRMRKTPAIMAPPPPTPLNSIETKPEQDESRENEADGEDAETRSRRPPNDIKFMLTSAGDQAETKILLEVEHQQQVKAAEVDVSEPTQPIAEADTNVQTLDILKEADRDFEHILLQNEHQEEPNGYKLDYYRQLKMAISKYFFSLKKRRLASSSFCDRPHGNERRSKLLRQHSDTTNSSQRQLSIESRSSSSSSSETPNHVDKCNLTNGQLCSCCATNHVPKLSLAHGSSRLRRNSFDSKTQKLTILQQQLEVQSALADSKRHSAQESIQVINRSSSNQSISSNGSTKSEQLHSSHHRLREAQLQLQSCQEQQEAPAQGSHLKPPNFLKLIFEPEGQAVALYSSSLALSPIKECSSNHSWASSQSSLTMSNGNTNPNSQQRKSSATSGNESLAKNLVEV